MVGDARLPSAALPIFLFSPFQLPRRRSIRHKAEEFSPVHRDRGKPHSVHLLYDQNRNAPVAQKWAILIGIDFYIDRNRRIKGATNDVNDIQLYPLRNHTSVRITKLVAIDRNDTTQTEPDGPESSWPTYDNITQEFKHVRDVASPGDFVYVHYSGYGASRPTKDRTYQADLGRDAALVLFDRKNGVRYLHGFELTHLLDEIVAKGIRLTLVLDCCCSGGVSRENELHI